LMYRLTRWYSRKAVIGSNLHRHQGMVDKAARIANYTTSIAWDLRG
jgi:hypothetical protein